MTIVSNYDTLFTAIQDYSKRDDVDDYIANFIRLSEIRINTKLQMRTNEVRSTATLATDDRFIVLPPGFLEMRSLRILKGNSLIDLEYRTPKQITIQVQPTTPIHYTINSKIELDAVPDEAYTLEMTFYKNLDALTETNQSNDVIAQYPNLYIYGALVELYLFVRDEGSAMEYMGVFDAALRDAAFEQNRGRYGPAPRMKSRSATP